jgi:hypothetical protein
MDSHWKEQRAQEAKRNALMRKRAREDKEVLTDPELLKAEISRLENLEKEGELNAAESKRKHTFTQTLKKLEDDYEEYLRANEGEGLSMHHSTNLFNSVLLGGVVG